MSKKEKLSFEEMLKLDRAQMPALLDYLAELVKRNPPVRPRNVTLH